MLLLEAAQVETGGAQWTLGGEAIDRSCGLEVVLSDYCGPDPEGGVIIEPRSPEGAMPYRTLPFGIIGRFRRSTLCRQPDDEQWLRAQMQAVTEQAVARALTVQSVFGTEAWIGADGVTEIPAPDPDNGRTLGDAICEARVDWARHNVGVPLLHISPCGLLDLARDGAVVIQDAKLWSIWGDQIVSSPGYAEEPVAFLTGPIVVHLSTIESEETIAASRNRAVVEATRVGLIEVAPCSMIRIGAAGEPLEPPPAPPGIRVDVVDQHATAHVDNAQLGQAGTIDWGDGYTDLWVQTSDDPTSSVTRTHNYTRGGTFTVVLRPGGGSQEITVEEPAGPKPTLEMTGGDFVVFEGGGQQQTTLSNTSEIDVTDLSATITVAGAAGKITDLVLTQADFNGPGQDLTTTFTVKGADPVGTYGPFPLLAGQQGATINQWSADPASQNGTYQVHDAVVSAEHGELVSNDFAMELTDVG